MIYADCRLTSHESADEARCREPARGLRNHMFYVVSTARIMLNISIVSYYVEYIICFSFTVYVIISCIIAGQKYIV